MTEAGMNALLEQVGSDYRVKAGDLVQKGYDELFSAIPGYVQRLVAEELKKK